MIVYYSMDYVHIYWSTNVQIIKNRLGKMFIIGLLGLLAPVICLLHFVIVIETPDINTTAIGCVFR